MAEAPENHWQEYLIEAFLRLLYGFGVFFGAVLFHSGSSPVIEINAALHNVFMGIAIAVASIAIICSPLGKRSGAHINPSVTLTFLRLRKIEFQNAAFYIAAQFAGGALAYKLAPIGKKILILERGDFVQHEMDN